jgi:hypothetical protein
MPSHTDPSIESMIAGSQQLQAQYAAVTLSLIDTLKGVFAVNIPLPTLTDATILNYQEVIARYPTALNAEEFVNGAQASLPPRWVIANPDGVQKVLDLVNLAVTDTLKAIAVWNSDSMVYTVGSNGLYISVGATIQHCSATEWAPLSDFYAIALVLAIWTPAQPYPGFPEPVNISEPGGVTSGGNLNSKN